MESLRRRQWRPTRGVAFIVGLIVSASLVGGCTVADDENDPSNKTGSTSALTPDDLVATAKSFHECLNQAGLPVAIAENHDGHMSVVQFTGDHWLMVRSPEGGTLRWSQAHGSDSDPQAWDIAQEFFSHGNEPGLMIDGVDHSIAYRICLERSGYDSHAAWGTTTMDSYLLIKQVEANNRWVKCARNNGWPMIEDSHLPEEADSSEWPMAYLPITITSSELRSLLGSCPNFDPAQQDALDQWWHTDSNGGFPPDYLPDPSIDFYVPSLKDSPDLDVEPTDEEQQALDNIGDLYTVIKESSAQYWQDRIKSDG